MSVCGCASFCYTSIYRCSSQFVHSYSHSLVSRRLFSLLVCAHFQERSCIRTPPGIFAVKIDKMSVSAELQAEAVSIVHNFLLSVDKSLADEFSRKTKAVSYYPKPRVPTIGTTTRVNLFFLHLE